jgi:hypothetical protein
MPTPKVNSWLGWRIFTINRSQERILPPRVVDRILRVAPMTHPSTRTRAASGVFGQTCVVCLLSLMSCIRHRIGRTCYRARRRMHLLTPWLDQRAWVGGSPENLSCHRRRGHWSELSSRCTKSSQSTPIWCANYQRFRSEQFTRGFTPVVYLFGGGDPELRARWLC